MLSHTVAGFCLLAVTSAHFQLNFPKARGFSEDTEENFPCGGFNDVQQQRTNFPISGGPIQLNLEHPQTNIAVYMAIGDSPGSGFSIVAKQQLTVQGLGSFCFGSISVPQGMNVSDGTPASIQVVTNGDDGGGLYQCADVTLVNTPLSQNDYSQDCKNNTGVKVSQENVSGNPNTTATTGSSNSTSPNKTNGAEAQAKAAPWVLSAVGLAGMFLL